MRLVNEAKRTGVTPIRVLDLFAGLRGWSDPWLARGHDVVTLDNEEGFGSNLTMDIRTFAEEPERFLGDWKPDIILASPPCEAFSVMTIGKNWTVEHEPKTEKARLAIELVEATLDTITKLRPRYFVIENPRAKLRKLELMADLDRVTVTYCQYGEPYMKPTDLWGGFPPSWWPRPPCKPRSPCHASAARGSKTGVQGDNAALGLSEEATKWLDGLPPRKSKTFRGGMIEQMARFPSWSPERKRLSALRAKIPQELSLELCIATEKDV